MRIHSEIHPLKKVIVHRPDLSLKHLTPENCQTFLFDDVLWAEKANEEHRVFTDALKACGVEVYLLHDLMSETLNHPAAKDWLLASTLQSLNYPQNMTTALQDYLAQHSHRLLTNCLLGGLSLDEVNDATLKKQMTPHIHHEMFVLPPLPNHLFTRDTSCWIGNGVSINPMHFAVRQRETLNMAAIYKFHPLFQSEPFHIWYDGSVPNQNMPSLEGGDVLVLNQDCVLIGLSQRTSLEAITLLAKALFSKQAVKQIIVVDIPKKRSSMHLDTIMTMIDHATFCLAFPPEQYQFRTWLIKPGADEESLQITQLPEFFPAVAKTLGESQLKFITPPGDRFTTAREQWNDASNLLAIAPGKVVAYDRNGAMNQQLRAAGIELIEIPGSELSRGRGGSRCMSCPIEREET
ncbi:MAG: arginine deiminase [Gammaproteobacteria bacterium]|nr:arginine deiminase [Gammaproteobacteria bacterium]